MKLLDYKAVISHVYYFHTDNRARAFYAYMPTTFKDIIERLNPKCPKRKSYLQYKMQVVKCAAKNRKGKKKDASFTSREFFENDTKNKEFNRF